MAFTGLAGETPTRVPIPTDCQKIQRTATLFLKFVTPVYGDIEAIPHNRMFSCLSGVVFVVVLVTTFIYSLHMLSEGMLNEVER